MKFSISDLKEQAILQPFSFDKMVDVSEILQLPNIEIRQIDDVRVEGICVVEEGHTFTFSYTISGNMILPCARTLVDVPYDFMFNSTEIFSTLDKEENEEEDIHILTEDTIDLKPYIMETIVLKKPYRIFSNEKMIDKGDGWKFYTEDELLELKKEQVDPRLEKLKKMFSKDDE